MDDNNEEWSPIKIAVIAGRLASVKKLVASGLDVNKSIGFGTPLHYAVRMGHLRIVNFLIENGADVNKTTEIIEDTDEGNSTPLHDAANHEYANIAERLIEAGADVNARDAEGHTPLDIVAGNLLRYRMYLYDGEPEKNRQTKLKMFTDTIAVLERHGGRLSHGGTLTEDGANRHREVLLQHGAEITKSLASQAFERRKHLLYAWVAAQETVAPERNAKTRKSRKLRSWQNTRRRSH